MSKGQLMPMAANRERFNLKPAKAENIRYRRYRQN